MGRSASLPVGTWDATLCYILCGILHDIIYSVFYELSYISPLLGSR